MCILGNSVEMKTSFYPLKCYLNSSASSQALVSLQMLEHGPICVREQNTAFQVTGPTA
jgi:hypothetical protein